MAGLFSSSQAWESIASASTALALPIKLCKSSVGCDRTSKSLLTLYIRHGDSSFLLSDRAQRGSMMATLMTGSLAKAIPRFPYDRPTLSGISISNTSIPTPQLSTMTPGVILIHELPHLRSHRHRLCAASVTRYSPTT